MNKSLQLLALSQICCPREVTNAQRTRATAGLGKCSDSAQAGSSLSMLCFQTGAKHKQGQVTGQKRLAQKQGHDFGEILHKTRRGPCLPPTYQARIHCLLQRVLETRATFSSRDAHLARFPKHLPLPCQGIRKITPISLPCRAPTPKAAPALLQKIFLLLCREALSSSPELTGFPPCCAETNGY